ncbi:MAG TPA: ABC transporter substrate-binding protein [Acidimicrobiales bacterium]|jgi:peptide/nickel transport system substrate-binding protein|nr:ABC transporter substrate-binding protein [Acidimicrobiales bacterium]
MPKSTTAPVVSRRPLRRSPMIRGLLPLVLVASLIGGFASSSGSASAASSVPKSHTLQLSFLQDPGQPPDPDVYYAGQGLLLTRNLYEGLVKYKPGTANRVVQPSLATSWAISNGGLTYTFQLRQGVVFHDGTPFNSSAINPDFARRTAVNGGPAYMVAGVASVQTPGPYTAVINLQAPNTAFLDYLASSYGPVMESPTALAKYAGTDNDQTYLQTHDVGTGPYTLTQAKVGVSYQLQAFPQYWGKKPYYTTVNIPVIDNLSTQEIQFNSGQLAGILHDLTAPAVAQYRANSAVNFYALPVIEEEGVYINEHRGFLTTRANRQAVLKAVNTQAIVAGVFPNRATVATQATPKGLLPPSLGKQNITYDPSALSAIVKKLPSSQKSFTVGYDSGAPDDQLVAEQIAAELQALGLTTKVVGYQTSEIYGWIGSTQSAASQGPDLLVYYVWPDAYNAYTWNHITYDSTGGLQYLTCSVPGIDAVDTQAVTTGSTATYNTAVQMAVKEGCWLNVADRNDAMVFHPWMKGVNQAHVVAMPWALLLNQLYPG